MPERRKQKRDVVTVPIEYSLSTEGGDKETASHMSGIMLNSSNEGICLYTALPLSEGTNITLSSRGMTDTKKGLVKWCRRITADLYRVGVVLR